MQKCVNSLVIDRHIAYFFLQRDNLEQLIRSIDRAVVKCFSKFIRLCQSIINNKKQRFLWGIIIFVLTFERVYQPVSIESHISCQSFSQILDLKLLIKYIYQLVEFCVVPGVVELFFSLTGLCNCEFKSMHHFVVVDA